MIESPLVSIVLPTYNRASYLAEAIQSVFSQTYAHWELLVVDDGSTDETATFVGGLSDPRIRYLYQKNAGRSAARNRGLAEARGRYVAFLDDDDLYLPHKLATQVAFLEAHPEIGLVASGAQIIAADGRLLRERYPWRERPELTLPACLYACPLMTCAVLLRRDWLARLDQAFDVSLDRAEDTDLWVRLLLAGCTMQWVPEIVSAYRQHGANSQQDRERYYLAFLALLDKWYARADLPPFVRAEQPALYAHYHVLGACHAYRAGQVRTGQERLARAAALHPALLAGSPPPIIAVLAHAAQTDGKPNSIQVIDAIFDQLPSSLASLQRYRGYAHSVLPMQRVFAAHRWGLRPRVSDWMQGVWLYPRWIRNRGVWSILVRDILFRAPKPGRLM